ncbi:MAG: hypothetical protein M1491_06810 [Deltaproteobacteria bacterium]|nr:hypothetical protein [Deltaproteobacteria bacterium]MCL5276501.1 hypothetical protein [Deltaproteobacteria bacterium]
MKKKIASGNRRTSGCPYVPDTDGLIRAAHLTVVEDIRRGRGDHYRLATRLGERQWRGAFLMQRSSSMILGPESGNEGENNFYRMILQKIKDGAEFRHIVSLEGIFRRLQRRHGTFGRMEEAFKSLVTHNWKVGIEGPVQTWYFKKISDKEDGMDIRPDRQARIFLVEFASEQEQPEGIIAMDPGGTDFCLHLKGPMVRGLMHACQGFYDGCQNLYLHELREVLGQDLPQL